MSAVVDVGLAADIIGFVDDRRELSAICAEVRRLLSAELEHSVSSF